MMMVLVVSLWIYCFRLWFYCFRNYIMEVIDSLRGWGGGIGVNDGRIGGRRVIG